MFDIIKSCKTHGALTIQDVYIRNTRKGMDCKWCSKESAIRRREENPDKFKEHGRKYRHIDVPLKVTIRKCSGCQKELSKELFANYAWNLRHPYCKNCMSIANYKSKIKNKDTYQQYKIKSAESSRRSYLRRQWGLTLEDFNELKISQNGLCAICKINSDILHIDHNHETGKIRALLCNQCNRGIGYLKESPEILNSAIQYLAYHSNIVST
jgi:hypothetical protein